MKLLHSIAAAVVLLAAGCDMTPQQYWDGLMAPEATTYVQYGEPPTCVFKAGDIWIDESYRANNQMYRYNGKNWDAIKPQPVQQ